MKSVWSICSMSKCEFYLMIIEGNARNWWKNETRSHYNSQAQCMIKQYSAYELPNGLKINGDLTLKENIADNGALKEAYNAYEKYTERFGPEMKLPGLKYTPRQLFWISAAMVCRRIQMTLISRIFFAELV